VVEVIDSKQYTLYYLNMSSRIAPRSCTEFSEREALTQLLLVVIFDPRLSSAPCGTGGATSSQTKKRSIHQYDNHFISPKPKMTGA